MTKEILGYKNSLIPLVLGVFYRQLALYRISGVPSFFKGPQGPQGPQEAPLESPYDESCKGLSP